MEDSTVTVSCGDMLDISGVTEFHQKLKEHLSEGKQIVLEASDVERADTSMLQMLTALFAVDGVQVKWNGVSETLKHSARLLGLEEHLKLHEIN